MLEKDFVYMVQLDWSTDDDQGVETYLFNTREKAIEEFNKIISDDKKNYWNDMAYNNGELDEENYELDTNIEDLFDTDFDIYWNIKNKYDYYIHDLLELRKMEIN